MALTDFELQNGLKDLQSLEQLTEELERLAESLKSETRTRARWIILHRAHEIMTLIRDRSATASKGIK